MSALVVDELTNQAPQLCKAWVNFDGTGTVVIRDSYNVSSITDNGVGDYTANFANPMTDINYSPTCSQADNGSASAHWSAAFALSGLHNMNSIRVITAFSTSAANRTLGDVSMVLVQVFGN